jgi:hypothetical protein
MTVRDIADLAPAAQGLLMSNATLIRHSADHDGHAAGFTRA